MEVCGRCETTVKPKLKEPTKRNPSYLGLLIIVFNSSPKLSPPRPTRLQFPWPTSTLGRPYLAHHHHRPLVLAVCNRARFLPILVNW
jgi:hypothetical protein